MIDRQRLERARGRLAELRAAQERGEVDLGLCAAIAADLEWLIDRADALAGDNQRLAGLVADITEMVRDAKKRRFVPVTDTIGDALGSDGDEEE
jgi:hypothetical protein